MDDSLSPDEERLRLAGVRPTRQRRAVLGLLLRAGAGYVTADQTARLAQELRPAPRLATVYNVLNEFAKAGLLRRIDMGEKTVFCLDPLRRWHFLDARSGRLVDAPPPVEPPPLAPPPPPGWRVEDLDVFVRLSQG